MSPPTMGSPALTNEEASGADEVKDRKRILKQLQEDASTEVKRLIQAYKPTVKYDTNMKALKRFTDTTLEEAATFFGATPTDGDGNKRYKNKHTLVDWIIMAIEGMFPQFCGACEATYTVGREEQPRFRCCSCGGGSHNCDPMMAEPKSRTPGFNWTCFGCDKKNTIEKFAELDIESPPRSAANSKREETLKRKFSFVDLGTESIPAEDTPALIEDAPAPTQETKTDRPIKVCQFYLQRRCRHGRSGTKMVNGSACSRSHPAMCRKFCAYGNMKKYGCTQGGKCRYYHPVLCKQSELKHECLKTDCKLHHLRNTRRSQPGSEKLIIKPPASRPAVPNVSYAEVTQQSSRNQQPSGQFSEIPASTESDFLERLFHRLESRLEDLVNTRFRDRDFPPLHPSQSSWRTR